MGEELPYSGNFAFLNEIDDDIYENEVYDSPYYLEPFNPKGDAGLNDNDGAGHFGRGNSGGRLGDVGSVRFTYERAPHKNVVYDYDYRTRPGPFYWNAYYDQPYWNNYPEPAPFPTAVLADTNDENEMIQPSYEQSKSYQPPRVVPPPPSNLLSTRSILLIMFVGLLIYVATYATFNKRKQRYTIE